MQEVDPIELRPSTERGPVNRLLGNRQLWKNTIYSIAFLTYLCSFLFFGLAVADVRENGAGMPALLDLIVAIYFLTQVIFLFVLSGAVERRHQHQPIEFADRRTK